MVYVNSNKIEFVYLYVGSVINSESAATTLAISLHKSYDSTLHSNYKSLEEGYTSVKGSGSDYQVILGEYKSLRQDYESLKQDFSCVFYDWSEFIIWK